VCGVTDQKSARPLMSDDLVKGVEDDSCDGVDVGRAGVRCGRKADGQAGCCDGHCGSHPAAYVSAHDELLHLIGILRFGFNRAFEATAPPDGRSSTASSAVQQASFRGAKNAVHNGSAEPGQDVVAAAAAAAPGQGTARTGLLMQGIIRAPGRSMSSRKPAVAMAMCS
jgi:hypothetical protein